MAADPPWTAGRKALYAAATAVFSLAGVVAGLALNAALPPAGPRPPGWVFPAVGAAAVAGLVVRTDLRQRRRRRDRADAFTRLGLTAVPAPPTRAAGGVYRRFDGVAELYAGEVGGQAVEVANVLDDTPPHPQPTAVGFADPLPGRPTFTLRPVNEADRGVRRLADAVAPVVGRLTDRLAANRHLTADVADAAGLPPDHPFRTRCVLTVPRDADPAAVRPLLPRPVLDALGDCLGWVVAADAGRVLAWPEAAGRWPADRIADRLATALALYELLAANPPAGPAVRLP